MSYTVEVKQMPYSEVVKKITALEETVTEDIGNIDTALDRILEIQESLIGGDAE